MKARSVAVTVCCDIKAHAGLLEVAIDRNLLRIAKWVGSDSIIMEPCGYSRKANQETQGFAGQGKE